MDEEVIKEVNTFSGALDASKTGIWNGAIGVFEFEKFAAGTDCAGPQGGAAGSVASN